VFEKLYSAYGAGVMPVQSHVQTGCFRVNHLNLLGTEGVNKIDDKHIGAKHMSPLTT